MIKQAWATNLNRWSWHLITLKESAHAQIRYIKGGTLVSDILDHFDKFINGYIVTVGIGKKNYSLDEKIRLFIFVYGLKKMPLIKIVLAGLKQY